MPFDLTPSLIRRFWAKVDQSSDCWTWTAGRDPNGYGRISSGPVPATPLLAHRVSWAIHFSPPPDDVGVLHKCDNPPCVRPDHLFLGSQSANMQDASRKRRMPHGEAAPWSKLTAPLVAEIRSRYAAGGISQQALAREYGMGQPAIGELIRRETWKHV